MKKLFLILLTMSLITGPASAKDEGKGNPTIVIKTNKGVIEAVLFRDRAPITVENFIRYAEAKHYDGTVFHRVIRNFMIQGGGFTADMVQKPTKAPIPLEASNGLKNDTYTIAMARTGNPHSATSQFFINVKDNAMLNAPQPDGHGYAVFGKVVEGTAVVDKIKAVATGNKAGAQNVPVSPITIHSATLVK